MYEFTCIDSFCGAGGLGFGLQQAGFDIRLSFDIDDICIKTIKENDKYFKHSALVADISDMLNGQTLEICNIERGELFLLAGGPPCQGFSIQRRGGDIDPRNQLVFKYARLVYELFPKYFVMENVTGIAGKRGKTILDQLIDELKGVGYEVHISLLDAQDYGVPQRRKRYILVGERTDMGSHYEYPKPLEIHKTVRDAIGSLPEPPMDGSDYPGIPLHRRDRLSYINLKRIQALKPGQGREYLPYELLADCHKIDSSVIGHRNVYGRMEWDNVAPTITARFDSFTRGKFGHPSQDRSISLREGALLQTFPMDFKFSGNKVDIARQIGNAVPPVLAEQIGRSIIDCCKKRGERVVSYSSILETYLKNLQEQYRNATNSGQYTAELSYRVPLDTMVQALAKEVNPHDDIDVILEPTTQGKVGRPDWRIHNKDTMGIYGYIEGKGLSEKPFDTKPYAAQIKKYLELGHKLVITDGIDFVFCMDKDSEQTVISVISKGKMHSKDWSAQRIDPRFEVYMREFFKNPSPQQVNEAKLVELVAVRTRMLADDILDLEDIPPADAMNENEREVIVLLQGMRELVYNHNDPSLRTGVVFADFTAQVIMFCLLYAHRVLCEPNDPPAEKERKIYAYIREDLSQGEALTPFRNLMLYLRDHDDKSFFINQRIDECIKFLSFIRMTDQQLQNPNYHQLFELFLSKYDAKSRFDFGAYYTPKVLADFVVKLTNYVVAENFHGKSIYDDGNTIVDPCCGTGSFMEELIGHDPGDGSYTLCGIEILPAPYMLANYRMAVLEKKNGKKNNKIYIVLANTLSNSVFNGKANANSIEGSELLQANTISNLSLKLVIGNPPCSDTLRENTTEDFSIINDLMEDFRPPKAMRRGRQNIQKQVNNPFMQFLRWSCKKLLNSKNHSVLALVVPLSFLEAESYKYARKYLREHFSDVWAVAVDADARIGARSGSLFHTLQGRAVIVLTRKYGDATPITKVHFSDYSHSMRGDKECLLSDDISDIVSRFEEYAIDADTIAFSPAKPFDTEMYKKFWPVSDENGQNAIFLNHCSGIKLAPTAIFTHVKAPMLKRRSREIAVRNDVHEAMAWFSQQDKPPKEEKVVAFRNALLGCDYRLMDQTLANNIHTYSFRPFLTSNVLLWKDVLKKYSRIGGGGTRLRPEIIKAYSDRDTIGFAMAHAPKDLNPTLSQFVSFCWYYPDNDMCTRGNSHIYMNQYTNEQGEMSSNIASGILKTVVSMTGMPEKDAAREIVFYVYAVMCSQVYLDNFEGALFTVNQSDKRARVPIVADKKIFMDIAEMGKRIADLEKDGFKPENILGFNYNSLIESVPAGFQLKNATDPFDAKKELLLLSDGIKTIEFFCPLSLQRLNISGYDVIKAVWLKFNSYDFTHCDFTKDDMNRLLDFLNTIATHEKYVKELDEIIAPIFTGAVSLVENKN